MNRLNVISPLTLVFILVCGSSLNRLNVISLLTLVFILVCDTSLNRLNVISLLTLVFILGCDSFLNRLNTISGPNNFLLQHKHCGLEYDSSDFGRHLLYLLLECLFNESG